MREAPQRGGGCSVFTVVIALALLAVVVVLAIPSVVHTHDHHTQHYAIGGLKTIVTCESIFRENDKERDGNLDYGMLSELASAELVDRLIGSGTKGGYLYEAAYSPTTSEFLWWGTAIPTPETSARDPHYQSFFVNHAGVIFYTTARRIPVHADTCEVDSRIATVTPLGR